MPSSIVRSAPPQNASLPDVITAPLMAASAATFSTIPDNSSIAAMRDDVHRASGHVPGDERDAVGVDVEFEVRSWRSVLSGVRLADRCACIRIRSSSRSATRSTSG